MLWRGWKGAAYSMSKKLLPSLVPFWRDWFLDIFFKKFPLSFTMVLFFHTFGGGWCFILVFLDHASFLCHSILFQGTDFSISFQKSPLPSTITLCFHTLKGGQLGLGLFPCRILHCPHWFLAGGLIPYIFWRVSFVIHHCSPTPYFWGDWCPYFFQNTILASFDGVALPTSLHYSPTLLDFLSEGLLSL